MIEDCNKDCHSCPYYQWQPDIGTEVFPWYCSKYNQVFSENDNIYLKSIQDLVEIEENI